MQGADVMTQSLEEMLRTPSVRLPHLAARQNEAAVAFSRTGFPTVKNEDWRFTNVTPIARASFVPNAAMDGEFARCTSLGGVVDEILIVNGRLQQPAAMLPEGVSITRGHELDAASAAMVGRLAASNAHPFVALNLALLQELIVVRVIAGCRTGTPLHIAHVVTSGSEPIAIHTRVIVMVEATASLSLIESFCGSGRYFTNTVTELHLGDGAIVDHVRYQNESTDAWHIGNLQVRLERDSVLRNTAVSRGAAIARNEIGVVLGGPGAECSLNGLYSLTGTQRVENHTLLDHASPHTASTELYKGLLDGKSNGIFDAKIVVRKDAQKITSKQTNKNLLLSLDAVADSNPQLEIYADDVKCGHGSTIGQLDEAQLFYLRSRGIDEPHARALLTAGFGGEVIDAIRIEPIRTRIRRDLQHVTQTEEVA